MHLIRDAFVLYIIFRIESHVSSQYNVKSEPGKKKHRVISFFYSKEPDWGHAKVNTFTNHK